MAVFYKYQYTNKRKNIHPWDINWKLSQLSKILATEAIIRHQAFFWQQECLAMPNVQEEDQG